MEGLLGSRTARERLAICGSESCFKTADLREKAAESAGPIQSRFSAILGRP